MERINWAVCRTTTTYITRELKIQYLVKTKTDRFKSLKTIGM